jgi:hypothetical protein
MIGDGVASFFDSRIRTTAMRALRLSPPLSFMMNNIFRKKFVDEGETGLHQGYLGCTRSPIGAGTAVAPLGKPCVIGETEPTGATPSGMSGVISAIRVGGNCARRLIGK